MPLTLTDIPTGKSLKPLGRPTPAFERTDAGGRLLVAVLAPVPPRWFVLPLTVGNCSRNGAKLTGPAAVAVGDTLALGQKTFGIADATTPDAEDSPDAAPAAATCAVTVRFQNAELARSTAIKHTLIGSDPGCGISLPADTKLAPFHALLAVVENRWHLFALTDAGFGRFGSDGPVLAAPLVRGESVWLGDVELTVTYDELDPLDFGYSEPEPEAAADPLGGDDPDAETETAAAGSPSTPHAPLSTPSGGSWTMTAVSASRDNEFQLRALALCAWLQDEHVKAKPLARPGTVRGPALDPDPAGDEGDVDDLERFATRLKLSSWDPLVLFDLAAYLWRVNLADNARWVLKELYRQNPADPIVAESLAVVYRSQAADGDRATDARVADIKRAHKYAVAAANMRPQDFRLVELVRAIGSEQTLLEMSQSGPAGRRPGDRRR